MWTTTISLEFISDSKQHLKVLGEALKHIPGVDVSMVEPVNPTSPVLIAIGVDNNARLAVETVSQNVAHTLYTFLHDEAHIQSQQHISLVTIEGERVDISPLSIEALTQLLIEARENEPA